MPYLFQQILSDTPKTEHTFTLIYKAVDYFKLTDEDIKNFKTNLPSGFIGKCFVLIMKNLKTNEMFALLEKRDSEFYKANVGDCFWVLENQDWHDNKIATLEDQYKEFRSRCFTKEDIETIFGKSKVKKFYDWFKGKTGELGYNPETKQTETGFYKSDVEWFLKNNKK